MSAEVPRLISQGQVEAARGQTGLVLPGLSAGHFFLELQKHDIPELESINRTLLELGQHYNARYIATNDVHYIEPGGCRYQDILLAIQTGALLTDPDRMRMTDPSYYLRSPGGDGRLFAEVPGALTTPC